MPRPTGWPTSGVPPPHSGVPPPLQVRAALCHAPPPPRRPRPRSSPGRRRRPRRSPAPRSAAAKSIVKTLVNAFGQRKTNSFSYLTKRADGTYLLPQAKVDSKGQPTRAYQRHLDGKDEDYPVVLRLRAAQRLFLLPLVSQRPFSKENGTHSVRPSGGESALFSDTIFIQDKCLCR